MTYDWSDWDELEDQEDIQEPGLRVYDAMQDYEDDPCGCVDTQTTFVPAYVESWDYPDFCICRRSLKK